MKVQRIAIIGGGPAGSLAAATLADGGATVTVYEEKLTWEKPCGGGLSYKVLERYPFFLAASAPVNCVKEIEIIAPGAPPVRFGLPKPMAIYSRSTLNQLLSDHAQAAGARTVQDRIFDVQPAGSGWRLRGRRRDYECDYVILATGTGSLIRRRLVCDLPANDYVLTLGYYIPRGDEPLRLRFFEDFEGYAWAFPRTDHVAVGIGGRCGQYGMADLRDRLHNFMGECGYSTEGATVYSHLLPSLRACSWGTLPLAGPNCGSATRNAAYDLHLATAANLVPPPRTTLSPLLNPLLISAFPLYIMPVVTVFLFATVFPPCCDATKT